MPALDKLIAAAGRWSGKSRLIDSHSNLDEQCDSTLGITPILNGKFVRIDYDWTFKGKPQQGVFLIGFESGADEVTAQWADTFHMQDKVMACRGKIEEESAINILGSYAAPPGPDWGWRTAITPSDSGVRLVMYNVTPDGEEELAVDAMYEPMAS